MIEDNLLELEKRLTIPREKPRSLTVSLAYKLVKLGKKILGNKKILKICLDIERLFWRFSFETAGEMYGAKFHNQAKALNERILSHWIPHNGSVIDVGCGIGRWCRVASRYSKSVVGIDYNKALIDKARSATKEDNIEFIVGDVTKELSGRKFDVALLTHVIEHIENVDTILKELKNVANLLIVEVPDFEHDPLNWVRLEQKCHFYTDGDHVREYTEELLVKHLERNEWQVLETYKHGGAVLAIAKQV